MEQNEEIIEQLRGMGVLERTEEVVLEELGGGVSSDVWKVRTAQREFVVKRSVPKLRVAAEWFSDPARLRYEFLYLRTAAAICPSGVPRLLNDDPDDSLLAMEYLGDGFANWKQLLLAGEVRSEEARRAGQFLGRVHAATTDSASVQADFPTMQFFTELRIDAYLRATAERQKPGVAAVIRSEADRLTTHHECLVHGDYSPKNMMVSRDRLVVLDCETACFGDPSFDLAFVLNHLCLKALLHFGTPSGPVVVPLLRTAVEELRGVYAMEQAGRAGAVEARAARLLPMLWLARVDGKSPVEYLDPARQQMVRGLAPAWILREAEDLSSVLEAWFAPLQ